MFKTLLVKALAASLEDSRYSTYKAAELSTPEYGAAHRKYGSGVYKTFAIIHMLDWTRFPDELSTYVDNPEWSTQDRFNHLQKVVGKHRRRVR